jgi:hypothetical protein
VFKRATGIRVVSHVAYVFAGVGTLGSAAFNVQKQRKIIPEVTVKGHSSVCKKLDVKPQASGNRIPLN